MIVGKFDLSKDRFLKYIEKIDMSKDRFFNISKKSIYQKIDFLTYRKYRYIERSIFYENIAQPSIRYFQCLPTQHRVCGCFLPTDLSTEFDLIGSFYLGQQTTITLRYYRIIILVFLQSTYQVPGISLDENLRTIGVQIPIHNDP